MFWILSMCFNRLWLISPVSTQSTQCHFLLLVSTFFQCFTQFQIISTTTKINLLGLCLTNFPLDTNYSSIGTNFHSCSLVSTCAHMFLLFFHCFKLIKILWFVSLSFYLIPCVFPPFRLFCLVQNCFYLIPVGSTCFVSFWLVLTHWHILTHFPQ